MTEAAQILTLSPFPREQVDPFIPACSQPEQLVTDDSFLAVPAGMRAVQAGAAEELSDLKQDLGLDIISARLLSALHTIKVPQALSIYAGRTPQQQPLFLNLENQASWHVLIQGKDGAVKSDCLRSLVTALVFAVRQSRVQLVGIDPGGRELGMMEAFPHMLTDLASDMEFVMRLFVWLDDELQRRVRTGTDWPHIVLVINDLDRILQEGGRELSDICFRLLVNGRHAGLHMLATTTRSFSALFGLRGWRLKPTEIQLLPEQSFCDEQTVEARNVHIVRRGHRVRCEIPWMSANDMNIAVRLMHSGWRLRREFARVQEHVL